MPKDNDRYPMPSGGKGNTPPPTVTDDIGLPAPELRKEDVKSIFQSLSESLGDLDVRAVAPESERQYVEAAALIPKRRAPVVEAAVVLRQSVIDEAPIAALEPRGRRNVAWTVSIGAAVGLVALLALRAFVSGSSSSPATAPSVVPEEMLSSLATARGAGAASAPRKAVSPPNVARPGRPAPPRANPRGLSAQEPP